MPTVLRVKFVRAARAAIGNELGFGLSAGSSRFGGNYGAYGNSNPPSPRSQAPSPRFGARPRSAQRGGTCAMSLSAAAAR